MTMAIITLMGNTWRERISRISSRTSASLCSARIRRALTMSSPQRTTATSTSRWRNVEVSVYLSNVFLYFQALIDELFHPSSTTTTTTTTPATTSTQRLPIKAHELGWELSPIDLVMANSVLEPVFSDDQKQVSLRNRELSEGKSTRKKGRFSDYLTHINTSPPQCFSDPRYQTEDAR